MARLQVFSLASLIILSGILVATSVSDYSNKYSSSSYFPHLLPNGPPFIRRQSIESMPNQGFIDMLMYGLAGIPVYKAVGRLLPLFKSRKNLNSNNGRVTNSRHKRDLPYAQQLLSLLISVENALEKYGITDPQCQLRATCEIHRKNVNAVTTSHYERRFIKLVREMRKEIQNPKVVPLAKYVFEYYEEAAIRGEELCDCGEKYPRCPQSLDDFYKKSKEKSKEPREKVKTSNKDCIRNCKVLVNKNY